MTTQSDTALPQPIGTRYAYEPALRDGQLIYLAGQIAKTDHDRLHATGRLGAEVELKTACRSAEIAAEQALAWLHTELGSDEELERILRVNVYVAVEPTADEISEVADAAAQVFSDHLGARGKHVRSVIGVTTLPRGATVLLEVTARVRSRD